MASCATGPPCNGCRTLVRTVEQDGKRVTYASDGEMTAALADLDRQIAGATDRIPVVRIQSSKGL